MLLSVVSVRRPVHWHPAAAVPVKLRVGLVRVTCGSVGFGRLGGIECFGRGSLLPFCFGKPD